jgi:2-hydroxychromene-2-carboxylate isomerase
VAGGEHPVFYYDLRSPECWLAAERMTHTLGLVPEWQPVLLDGLGGPAPWWSGEGRERGIADVELRASGQGIRPLRWPEGWPNDVTTAMLAATFAKQSARAVAYSLAAFRQQFAAARDLSVTDNVLIAAAACELHPRALLKGVESRAVRDALDGATAEAARRGVRELPAIGVGDRIFAGPEAPELAAEGVRPRRND